MPGSAFQNSVWRPGEPLDPSTPRLGPQELSDRLLFLEKAIDDLQVQDLPLAGLMKTLEQEWLPDPSTLFPSGTVSSDSLSFTSFYGQVGSAGTIVVAGSGKWTVMRNGAGDYTVTFPTLKNTPTVVGTPATSVTGFRVSAKTNTTARFIMSADSDFDFWVAGK